MKRAILSYLGCVLLWVAMLAPAFAAPAIPTPTKVTQPDGTVLQVQIMGDEHQNWVELLPTRQTIMKNHRTKVWEYAAPLPDGTLAPSGVRAEPGGKNAPALPSHLKPPRSQELEKEPPQAGGAAAPAVAPAEAVSGTRKVLVILVNFSDRTLITTPAGWYSKIFDAGSGNKSMANFWKDNSFGAVTVSPAAHSQPGNPAGIITATIADQHPNYGGEVSYDSDEMVANHALAEAARYIDFASYDSDGDGTLAPEELAIYFIYAGYEAAGSTLTPSVWAHAWSFGTIAAGTTMVNYWALNGELNDSSAQHPVGVVVHELGHALFGLIDLYDTSGYNEAMGNFTVMAAGSWGADIGEYAGTTPTTLDAWSRQLLGWTTPVEPARGTLSIPSSLSASNAAFKLIHPTQSYSEYFLVDNRQPVGWDRGLRSFFGSSWLGGVLILHVDDNEYDNRYRPNGHQKVVPVQASTKYCDMLEPGGYCRGDATTLFYEWNNSAWTQSSSPSSNYYDGIASGFSLTGISTPMSVMTASYHPDTVPPVVTTFIIPSTSTTLAVPIYSIAATDNLGVAAYLVTESSTPPRESDPAWSATKPTSYIFTGAGEKTLYAWAKDVSGNVSAFLSNTVTVTASDLAPPTVTAFAVPATSSSLTVPITTLTATDNVGVTGYLINEASGTPALSDPGWSPAKPVSYTFSSGGNKTLYAWAKDAAGNVSTSRSATVTVTAALPAPWLTADVGSVGVPGSASYLDGIFTLKGSGANIWGSADAFRFVYQQLPGDGEITARVTSVQNTNQWAKGGVMIRQALTAGAMHAMVDITPGAGAEFSRRTATGGTTTVTASSGKAAPYWVKLVQKGSTFTGSTSADGVTWVQLGSSTINMAGPVYVGLIANSHNNAVLCNTTVERVSVSGADATPPTVTAFAVPATSSSLTVAITTLTASDNVGVTGYLVNESAGKPSATAAGWSTASPASYTFASAGSKTLYAWARDAAGNVSNSRSATVTVTGGGLPAPWLTGDVGSVGAVGSASYAGGVFSLKGSGANIYGTADAFRFAYQPMAGDMQIVARVISVQNTNSYAKAGVMIRQSLTANSAHAMIDITPTSGAEFSRRTTTGGSTTPTARTGFAAPYWVKLVRSGSSFTGSISPDGVTWTQLGSATISMTGTVYVGLIVNSHNNSVLCTVNFDNVAVTGTGPDTSPPTVTGFTIPATSSSLTVPISTFTATDDRGVTGYLLTESSSKPSATAGGWSATAPGSYSFASTGTKTLYAWAKDAAGNVSDSRSATVTVSGGGLPSPWLTQDIGSVGLSGSASYSNGVFTVKGSGGDVWNTADAFRFVYKPMTGDGEIVARVTSLQNTNSYAKGGVMIRQSLTANSMHAMMDLRPTGGAEFSRRTTTGGTTSATTRTGIAVPYWVRLVRSGSTFTGYVSANGTTWSQVGSATINMGSSVYVGVLVNSHNNSALCTATIEAVK